MSLETAINELNGNFQVLIALLRSPAGSLGNPLAVDNPTNGTSQSDAESAEKGARKRRTKAEMEAAKAAETATPAAEITSQNSEKHVSMFDEQRDEEQRGFNFLDDEEEENEPEKIPEIKIEQLRALARELISDKKLANETGPEIEAILARHKVTAFPELKGDLQKHHDVYTRMLAVKKKYLSA